MTNLLEQTHCFKYLKWSRAPLFVSYYSSWNIIDKVNTGKKVMTKVKFLDTQHFALLSSSL